jgi:hypothetical protein
MIRQFECTRTVLLALQARQEDRNEESYFIGGIDGFRIIIVFGLCRYAKRAG